MTIVLAMVAVSASAGYMKCTVVGISEVDVNDKAHPAMIVLCQGSDITNVEVGTKVKVKVEKVEATIEGC